MTETRRINMSRRQAIVDRDETGWEWIDTDRFKSAFNSLSELEEKAARYRAGNSFYQERINDARLIVRELESIAEPLLTKKQRQKLSFIRSHLSALLDAQSVVADAVQSTGQLANDARDLMRREFPGLTALLHVGSETPNFVELRS